MAVKRDIDISVNLKNLEKAKGSIREMNAEVRTLDSSIGTVSKNVETLSSLVTNLNKISQQTNTTISSMISQMQTASPPKPVSTEKAAQNARRTNKLAEDNKALNEQVRKNNKAFEKRQQDVKNDVAKDTAAINSLPSSGGGTTPIQEAVSDLKKTRASKKTQVASAPPTPKVESARTRQAREKREQDEIEKLEKERLIHIEQSRLTQPSLFTQYAPDITPRRQYNVKASKMALGYAKTYADSIANEDNPKGELNRGGMDMAAQAIAAIKEKDYNVLVAKAGREVVGGLAYKLKSHITHRQADITNVGTKYRGMGAGDALMDLLEEQMIKQRVDTSTIPHAYPAAHNLYMRHGYIPENMQDVGIRTTRMTKYYSNQRFLEMDAPNITPMRMGASQDELRALLARTNKSGREEAYWKDLMTGKENTPSYLSSGSNIDYMMSIEKAKELAGTLSAAYHSHPGHLKAIPSIQDVIAGSAIPGMTGIVSGAGNVMEMQVPKNINANAFSSEWGNAVKKLSYTAWQGRTDSEYQQVIQDEFLKIAKKFNIQALVYDIMPQSIGEAMANAAPDIDPKTYKDILNDAFRLNPKMSNKEAIAKIQGTFGSSVTTSKVTKAMTEIRKAFKEAQKVLGDPISVSRYDALTGETVESDSMTDPSVPEGVMTRPYGGQYKSRKSLFRSREYVRFQMPTAMYGAQSGQDISNFLSLLGQYAGDIGRFQVHTSKSYPVTDELRTQNIELSAIINRENIGVIEKQLQAAWNAAIQESPAITEGPGNVFVGQIGRYVKTPDTELEAAKTTNERLTAEMQNLKNLAKEERQAQKETLDRFTAEILNNKLLGAEEVRTKTDQLIADMHNLRGLDKEEKGRQAEKISQLTAETLNARGLKTEEKQTQRDLLDRITAETLNAKYLKAEQLADAKEFSEFILMAEAIPEDQRSQEKFWDTYMREYGATREAPPGTGKGNRQSPLAKGGFFEQVKGMGKDIGVTIDNLGSKGGILGKLSWTFTSLAMSALGVYFSLMSVVNMLSQGIMSVFNPLQNLQGAIQSYAMGQMKLKNGAADLDEYFKKLGVDIGDIAEGSLRFQSILDGFQTSLTAFGAKLMLDPEVWEDLQGILSEVQDFLTREETFTLVKGIISVLKDSLPDILEAFMFIGEVVRTMLPYAGLFAKAWAAALVIMPVASFVSALTNIGTVVVRLISMFGALKTAIATSTAVSQLGALGTLGAVGAGAAVGVAGVGALHNVGALSYVRESGYNLVHDEASKPYQHQDIPWWDVWGGITGSPTFRAGGGPLRAGQMAVVGEKGPEIIIPKGDVDVVPNHKVRFLADGTGMQSFQVHEANRLVEGNTDAVKDSTRATQELVSIFKQYKLEGTSVVGAYGSSPGGGATSETLKKAGPFTMSQGGKTWNMSTSMGIGEGLVGTGGSDVFGGTGTPAGMPTGEAGGFDPTLGLILGANLAPAVLAKLGGLKGLKGGLKGLGGKLGGLLGRGGALAAAEAAGSTWEVLPQVASRPATMEIADMLALSKDVTMTAAGQGLFNFGALTTGGVAAGTTAGVGLGLGGIAALDQLGVMEQIRQAGYKTTHGGDMTGYQFGEKHAMWDIPAAITGKKSILSTAFEPKPEVGKTFSLAEEKSNWDRLNAGQIKMADVLDAMHKDGKEGTEDTNMLLASLNSKDFGGSKVIGQGKQDGYEGIPGVAGMFSGGPGMLGKKPVPGGDTGKEDDVSTVTTGLPGLSEGYSYIGNHFMNGPEDNPWATGLTGDPLRDFAPGGEGWNRDYGAGDMYGPGGSAGAPSVKYGYDPYYPTQPGNNRDEWSQVKDKGARSGTGWSFTTPFKDTETFDFNKIQTVTDKNKGLLTMGGESTLIEKAGFDFAALEKAMKESEASKAKEEWGANLDRSDFGYMNASALRGGAEGAAGEIVTQGKDVFIRQADGSLKQIASAASGGLLKASGLINAHAGEVIGPLGQVASTIASAATINNNAGGSNQNISITVNINGNADQAVTDDMIRRIKKDLFGRGVIA